MAGKLTKPAAKSKVTPPIKSKVSTKPKKQIKSASPFDDIKKALILQRETLLSEAGMVINTTTVGGGSSPDLTDLASTESDQAFVLRLKEREQKLLNKIDETIDRINQGTYGICQNCENPIPQPRLKVRPVTTLCIECKTLEEEEEQARI